MQVPTSSYYCTPSGLACVAKVAKEAFDCKTPCTGVYADVFRSDDTKLTTEMMKLANLVHVLANEGGPQLHYTNEKQSFQTIFIPLRSVSSFCSHQP